MRRIRVIPTLLIQNGGLVKSVKFKNHRYVGDPINAVKIFNEKEIDEIIILDISASKENRPPDIKRIAEITSEAFMPLAYGGGITTIEQIKQLLFEGIEKVVLNKSAFEKPHLITEAANRFGSQSVVVSIDVKKDWFGRKKVFSDCGTKNQNITPSVFARQMEDLGAGEIYLMSIDSDGTYQGYDLDLIQEISSSVSIPVVAAGGAGNLDDFQKAVKLSGASAVAAGSMFVFQRPHQAVLISYPNQKDLKEQLFLKI
jgi:imidazole glycerol-phosphate synthase subunit HisF